MDQVTKEKIEYVIEKFNFERVHLTMKILDWGWAIPPVYKPDFTEIPSIVRMKTCARDLMIRAYNELITEQYGEYYVCGTGGFEATCSKEEDGKYDFVLKFVLTEFDSEFYDVKD